MTTPLIFILSQLNPIHIPKPCLLKDQLLLDFQVEYKSQGTNLIEAWSLLSRIEHAEWQMGKVLCFIIEVAV
jgi:hypothetical protein